MATRTGLSGETLRDIRGCPDLPFDSNLLLFCPVDYGKRIAEEVVDLAFWLPESRGIAEDWPERQQLSRNYGI